LEWIPAGESIRVQLMRRKAKSGHFLTVEERLALFDANTKWLDELQAEQLKEANAAGARITRENRGWTREELYQDRGFPGRHQHSGSPLRPARSSQGRGRSRSTASG